MLEVGKCIEKLYIKVNNSKILMKVQSMLFFIVSGC